MMKLKPCPFCGSKEIGIEASGNTDTDYVYFGYCWDCGGNGPIKDTEEKAAEGWNNRAGGESNES